MSEWKPIGGNSRSQNRVFNFTQCVPLARTMLLDGPTCEMEINCDHICIIEHISRQADSAIASRVNFNTLLIVFVQISCIESKHPKIALFHIELPLAK